MQEKKDAADAAEIVLVQTIATKAGLGRFARSHTEHFLGLGDADDRFRRAALDICESLAPAFLQHFRDKGFKDLALPQKRLSVITLKSAESYQAFTGKDPGPLVGGHFDLDTNRLVIFDFRQTGEGPAVVNNPQRVNRLALVHETTHLLCFNTGLLSRQVDVPAWVSEGLATYVELWQKKVTRIGELNGPWLFCLRDAKKTSNPWIPITELVADDKAFDDDETAQLAYAESWLLVHYLMKEPHLLQFRAYLGGLAIPLEATRRVSHVERHLGPVKDLEHDVERYLKRLSR
jgi:hypothetical protein